MFLLENHGLSKAKIGEYVGERKNADILLAFVRCVCTCLCDTIGVCVCVCDTICVCVCVFVHVCVTLSLCFIIDYN